MILNTNRHDGNILLKYLKVIFDRLCTIGGRVQPHPLAPRELFLWVGKLLGGGGRLFELPPKISFWGMGGWTTPKISFLKGRRGVESPFEGTLRVVQAPLQNALFSWVFEPLSKELLEAVQPLPPKLHFRVVQTFPSKVPFGGGLNMVSTIPQNSFWLEV